MASKLQYVFGDSKKFLSLMEKLISIINTKPEDKTTIYSYFHSLRELDCRSLNFTKQNELTTATMRLLASIQTADVNSVKSTCDFINNLMKNITLDRCLHRACIQWLLEILESSETTIKKDILVTLQNCLSIESLDVNDILQLLLIDDGPLIKYFDVQSVQCSELGFQAANCLDSIIENKNSSFIKSEFINKINKICFNAILCVSYRNNENQFYNKILNLHLHLLYKMIAKELVPISTDLIGEILGVVQVFLFHGIKGYASVKPQHLHPAAMNLPEPIRDIPRCKNLKNHKTNRNKHTSNKNICEIKNDVAEQRGLYKYSSDSDTSDSEFRSTTSLEAKVRMASIYLLRILVEKTQSRDIFGYWPQIVATGSRNDARVLTRSILKEPTTKIRQNVLITLTELLLSARPFLIHAEDTQPKSFITFFGTVYLMIKELHFTLSLIVNTERNAAVLTHVLKCIAALIQGTRYARLKPGLVTSLIEGCRPHLLHRDPTVRVAALSVFETLTSADPITPEIFNILAEYNNLYELELSRISTVLSMSEVETEEEEGGRGEEEEEEKEEKTSRNIENIENTKSVGLDEYNTTTEKNMSSLMYICLENIANKSTNVSVRLQSLKLIGRMAFATGKLVYPNLEIIMTILLSAIQELEVKIVLHATRVLEIISGSLFNNNRDDDGILFWNTILDSVISLAQHTETIIREAACDCLGSISANALSQLSRQKTIVIITILFSAVHDEESAVRAASVRALGIIVTLPSLHNDIGFLMDLANIVCLISEDENLGVRIKGAWALANLCDCIAKLEQITTNQCDSTILDSEPLYLETLLPRLYDVSVKGAKDNNKIKCNAVRAIGTILHLYSEGKMSKDTSLGLDVLINCATVGNDMKVRWNACRALGLVLKHNPDDILPPTWRDQVLPILCTLICQTPNFKVRTHAAWALSSCDSYGKYVVTIWKSIVLALENSQHVPSYIEYSHQDALIRQLCLTLCHVAACTKESELQNIWIEIRDHIGDLCGYMRRFQEGILPEKIGDLIEANAHLQNYAKHPSSMEVRQIAQTLSGIFERNSCYDTL